MKFNALRFAAIVSIMFTAFMMTGCQDGGSESTSSNGVNISPNDPGASSATTQISWSIPSTRILGDALSLSEIHGYKVYYGTEPGRYSWAAEIVGAQTTEVDVTLATGDTYYFVVRAIDTNGLEGPESNTVTRTL